MIKLLIFDLDGTLIDSADDIQAAINRLLIQEGSEPVSRQAIVDNIGEGLRKMLSGLIPNYRQGHPDYDRIEADFMRLYHEEGVRRVKMMPGALEFLHAWNGKIALVTNKNEAPTLSILAKLGLNKLDWQAIFGFDSLPTAKPDPGPLLEVLKRSKVTPEQALMVGDGVPDIKAAKAAGVRSVALNFGYGALDRLLEHHPDFILNSYSDLPKLIADLNLRS